MQFEINQAMEVLSGTPAVLSALLRDKSSAWLSSQKTPEAFSPIDVVGHLILADQTDWVPRIQMILENRNKGPRDHRPFEPFDRFAFQPLIEGKSIAELLEDFARVRHESLQSLQALHLEESELSLPGLHPELGPVTLRNLLATWVVHDLGHISQIVKAMSSAYSEAVGPWRAYLSVLN
jgi:hypothetical protein